MTVLDDRRPVQWKQAARQPVRQPALVCRPVRRAAEDRYRVPRQRSIQHPAPTRPASAPLVYAGTGVRMSRRPHAQGQVSTSVVVALAGLAALITLWLGSLAQFGAGAHPAAAIPERLAVVQVQAGESLQQLARRVAPDAPAGMVAERIRDLNKLGSASVDAGQTLIAPLG